MNIDEIPTPETDAMASMRRTTSEWVALARDLERRLTIAREALDKLARLGDEPNFGYSDGNIIAFNALART